MKGVDLNSIANIAAVVQDKEKWLYAEWLIRHQWINQLRRYHKNILAGSATFEEVDLFWVKLLGLIEELIPSELLESLTRARDLAVGRPELQDVYKQIGPQFEKQIQHTQNCVKLIENIRNAFSESELLFILDCRTHVAHPVANFYRLDLKTRGGLVDKYRDYDRLEIQGLLSDEYEKYRDPFDAKDKTTEVAALAYAKKFSPQILTDINNEIVEILKILNPALVITD